MRIGSKYISLGDGCDGLKRARRYATIERLRQKVGSGSPNIISPMLERCFSTLGKRLDGHGANLVNGEAHIPS